MKAVLCVAFLISAVSCHSLYGGYDSHHAAPTVLDTVSGKRFVKILRLVGSTDNAGNYNFDSEAADGTKMSETGGLKVVKGEVGATKTGSYSWISPENEHFTMTYTADENGFRPVAKHLPVSPPIPEEILKSLRLLPKLDLSEYEKPSRHAYDYSSHYVVPMKPVAPPAMHVLSKPMHSSALPPAPPASSQVEVLKPLEAPTKTHVETPEFLIDSDSARTFFRIGNKA